MPSDRRRSQDSRLRKVPEGSERSRVLQWPELTRKPSLRRETHSRDPRNDHLSSIARATEYLERGGRDLAPGSFRRN